LSNGQRLSNSFFFSSRCSSFVVQHCKLKRGTVLSSLFTLFQWFRCCLSLLQVWRNFSVWVWVWAVEHRNHKNTHRHRSHEIQTSAKALGGCLSCSYGGTCTPYTEQLRVHLSSWWGWVSRRLGTFGSGWIYELALAACGYFFTVEFQSNIGKWLHPPWDKR
jgi:hypothetical protein